MSFELSCSDQDDNVSRSTVFDGDTSTVLSQALSIQSQMTADEAADQQYSSLSLGKKRYRTEELPRAGVMKPKTPGETQPLDGGRKGGSQGGGGKRGGQGGGGQGGGSQGGNQGGGKGGGGSQQGGSKGGNVKKHL